MSAARASGTQAGHALAGAALAAARQHIERLGYRVLETHTDGRTGARLVVARSADDGELLLCELRAESFTAPAVLEQAYRRQRLRRGRLARRLRRPSLPSSQA